MILEALCLLAVMGIAAWWDLRFRRIPTLAVIGGLVAVAAIRWAHHALSPWLLGEAVIGFGVIGILHLVFRGRIGLGDALLSAFLAAALGIVGWVASLFLASLFGVVFILLQTARGRMTIRQSIAFAPFLAAGAAITFLASVIAFGDAPAAALALGSLIAP